MNTIEDALELSNSATTNVTMTPTAGSSVSEKPKTSMQTNTSSASLIMTVCTKSIEKFMQLQLETLNNV